MPVRSGHAEKGDCLAPEDAQRPADGAVRLGGLLRAPGVLVDGVAGNCRQ
jgi:hypothetical protein